MELQINIGSRKKKKVIQIKHYLNVCDIKGNEVEPVDIITFGSPCQDMSISGKRKGLKHEDNGDNETTRSGLFIEAVRIIKEMRQEDIKNGRTNEHIRPRYAVWENVPGAFSSNKGEDFRTVLEELARVSESEVSIPRPKKWKTAGTIYGDGWSIAWRVLDAQYHGVPQRRRRIFLVADFGGWSSSKILFECKGLSGYPTESGEPWKETTRNIGKGIEGTIPYTLQIRSGCEGGGKGPLIQTNKSACLTTVQTQTLFEPVCGDNMPTVAYGVVSKGNGDAFLINERHMSLSCGGGEAGQGYPCVCIQGSMIGREEKNGPQGDGINEDVSFTLNTVDKHAVCYGICSYDSNSMKSDNPNSGIYEAQTTRTLDLNGGNPACNQGGMMVVEPFVSSGKETVGTLMANAGTKLWLGNQEAFSGDYSIIEPHEQQNCIKYIVRRLIPKECQRLQGMPENWTCLHQITDISDEDYEFWKQAHKTYCEVNKKKYKEKSKEQMIKWYNELQKDAAEYKAYGNGMALPCVRVPIHGIAKQGAKTMASLFDGIGGFPLAGLLDGIECLWTSEIELFPIAVTKERFS